MSQTVADGTTHPTPDEPTPEEPTPAELAVITMWTELLGVESLSLEGDFFELGGQSLTLMQFIARVQERFGVELPVEVLFTEELTVAAAARAIDETLVANAGEAELDELLDELDQLSDEEVRALLAEDTER